VGRQYPRPVRRRISGLRAGTTWARQLRRQVRQCGGWRSADLDCETTQFLRAEYDTESPDGPDYFPIVHAKLLHMFATEPELDLRT
jgi:hypothetical protein